MAGKRRSDEERIKDMERELAEIKAKHAQKTRAERNGQLVALGIAIERGFTSLSEGAKREIESIIPGLDKRNKERAQAALLRIRKEGSPEPKIGGKEDGGRQD